MNKPVATVVAVVSVFAMGILGAVACEPSDSDHTVIHHHHHYSTPHGTLQHGQHSRVNPKMPKYKPHKTYKAPKFGSRSFRRR